MSLLRRSTPFSCQELQMEPLAKEVDPVGVEVGPLCFKGPRLASRNRVGRGACTKVRI